MALVNIGRQDWARIESRDSAVLLSESAVAHPGGVTFGPYQIAGFESIIGRLAVSSATYLEFEAQFYADAALTQLVGIRRWAMDGGAVGAGNISLECLGSYLIIVVTDRAGGAWSWTANLTASSRRPPAIFTPSDAVLIQSNGTGIAAGATFTINALEICSGPAVFHTYCQAQPLTLVLENEITAGGWGLIWADLLPANTPRSPIVVLPPRPVRARYINTGAAAATFQTALTTSLTGAT